MRTGVNPEKYKLEKNTRFFHRVIIPVFIPDTDEAFYKDSTEIFDLSLQSLIHSINPETTAITVVDNNSSKKINLILEKYYSKIDKVIRYKENKGKVYGLLQEARGAYEPFVTLADADVFFFPGWERKVWQIFETYPKAGIVSPVPSPHNALLFNNSVFFDKYFTKEMKYGKIIPDKDLELLKKGYSHDTILRRRNRNYSWEEKQYYLNGPVRAVVGASHFAATYRSFLFHQDRIFPQYKFRLGYENYFLDHLADQKGYFRLSTINNYVYHMGNSLDKYIESLKIEEAEAPNKLEAILPHHSPFLNIIPFFLKKNFFRVLRKLKKL